MRGSSFLEFCGKQFKEFAQIIHSKKHLKVAIEEAVFGLVLKN
jgi:hypothetical protein